MIAHKFCFVVLAIAFASVPALSQKIEAAGADLDQCANGTAGSPEKCTGSAWVNGNLNENQAHFAEDQFIPYRMKFSGLSTSGSHSVTIGYDYLKGTTHAIDYLGSYNATESDADPCSGINPACGASSTFPIPLDTATVSGVISPNTNLPIVQKPGVFTLFGGTITGVTYNPLVAGEERTITVTFTASQANPVLAWGGHIAWIGDWGAGGSAGTISGSPYHMRLKDLDGSGGNQDRSLKTTAVIQSGAVLIIKKVSTNLIDQADIFFPFLADASFDPLSFSLKDNNDGVLDRKLSLPINIFGAPGINVTETSAAPFSLNDVTCVEAGANSVANSTWVANSNTANIIVEKGETVTCTFTNGTLVPSAAPVSISGRVTNRYGRGISGAVVTVTDLGTGEVFAGRTNTFGYYTVDGLTAGDLFQATVSASKYTFATNSLSFSPTDNLTGVNFKAN